VRTLAPSVPLHDPGWLERALARYRHAVRMDLRLKGWRAYANLARSYYEYATGATTVKARPLKLIFDPTNVCQLACPLCPTGIGLLDRGRGHADVELFRRVMEEVGSSVFFVDFYNWGEPLLSPRLEELIRIAREHHVASVVSTNLSMKLSDERIERLLTSGVSEIGVALDGASAETNAVYRRKGKFDLVVDNMRRLVEARRRLGQAHPLISWYFVVFGFNEHEIPKARRMARDIGVDRLNLRPPFLDGQRYNLSPEDSRAIVTWAPRNPRYRTHVTAPPAKRRCGWHYTAAAINWDGTITPCSTAFRSSDDFGSLGRRGERPFAEVVNNDAFRSARGFMAGRGDDGRDVICKRCPTPTIRNYHAVVYRQVAIVTAVALLESLRRLLSLPFPDDRDEREHPAT